MTRPKGTKNKTKKKDAMPRKVITVRFRPEVHEFLNALPNKSGYIQELVRRDMSERVKNQEK